MLNIILVKLCTQTHTASPQESIDVFSSFVINRGDDKDAVFHLLPGHSLSPSHCSQQKQSPEIHLGVGQTFLIPYFIKRHKVKAILLTITAFGGCNNAVQ